ncbi:MAG: hypothetical protein QNK11_01850 [Legionella sp.]|nr:hypothetical protein [Legionella sp.]
MWPFSMFSSSNQASNPGYHGVFQKKPGTDHLSGDNLSSQLLPPDHPNSEQINLNQKGFIEEFYTNTETNKYDIFGTEGEKQQAEMRGFLTHISHDIRGRLANAGREVSFGHTREGLLVTNTFVFGLLIKFLPKKTDNLLLIQLSIAGVLGVIAFWFKSYATSEDQAATKLMNSRNWVIEGFKEKTHTFYPPYFPIKNALGHLQYKIVSDLEPTLFEAIAHLQSKDETTLTADDVKQALAAQTGMNPKATIFAKLSLLYHCPIIVINEREPYYTLLTSQVKEAAEEGAEEGDVMIFYTPKTGEIYPVENDSPWGVKRTFNTIKDDLEQISPITHSIPPDDALSQSIEMV